MILHWQDWVIKRHFALLAKRPVKLNLILCSRIVLYFPLLQLVILYVLFKSFTGRSPVFLCMKKRFSLKCVCVCVLSRTTAVQIKQATTRMTRDGTRLLRNLPAYAGETKKILALQFMLCDVACATAPSARWSRSVGSAFTRAAFSALFSSFSAFFFYFILSATFIVVPHFFPLFWGQRDLSSVLAPR